MERTVSPADCALAVALPLTLREFEEDAGSADRDFVRSVIEGSGRSLREAWDEVYAPKVVHVFERVAARAREAGATVVTGATATSLRELLERFPVVCLVAHSVLSSVEPADVLRPDAILRIIDAGDSIVARHLRALLGEQPPPSTGGDELRRHLAAVLESSLAETRAWFASVVRRAHADGRGLHVNRVMLEECFGDALRRSRLLELRDGMQTLDDLLAAVPLDFAGVLDLSVCNSVALGESIKRRRPRLLDRREFLPRADRPEARALRARLEAARAGSRPLHRCVARAEPGARQGVIHECIEIGTVRVRR